jgi:hypothetical protein
MKGFSHNGCRYRKYTGLVSGAAKTNLVIEIAGAVNWKHEKQTQVDSLLWQQSFRLLSASFMPQLISTEGSMPQPFAFSLTIVYSTFRGMFESNIANIGMSSRDLIIKCNSVIIIHAGFPSTLIAI